MVKAPWTDEQVESANGYQAEGVFHPFTCGECGNDLKAERDGWRCPTEGCTYTQDWAHDFMLDGSWRKAAAGLGGAFKVTD